MKLSVFSLGIISTVAITGCNPFNFNRIAGSGQITTTNYPLAGFECVEAGSSFDVHIQPGEKFAVTVTTDSNLIEDLSVTQDGKWLRLGTRSAVNISPTKLVANITMPSLTDISASGATHFDLGSFKMDNFEVRASGASRIDGDIHAQRGYLDCSGASEVTLSGEILSLTLKGSGASRLNCSKLMASKTDVDLSGASNADVNAREQMDYDLSGASDLNYAGNPRIGQSQCSGASNASRKGATF
jgi:hypothetical protein